MGNSTGEPASRRQDVAVTEALRSALPALCRERGFRNLDLATVCERAGVSASQIHSSYGDLQGAYVSIYREFATEFSSRMLSAYAAERGWRDQIRAVAYAFLYYLEEDLDRAYFNIVDAFNAGPDAQLIREGVFAGLYTLIDQGREELEDPDSLTAATAESVGGAIFLRVRVALEAGETDRLPNLVPELMQMVTLPYLGPEAAAEELRLPPPSSVAAGSRGH